MIKSESNKIGIIEMAVSHYNDNKIRGALFTVIKPLHIQYSIDLSNCVEVVFESELVNEVFEKHPIPKYRAEFNTNQLGDSYFSCIKKVE